MKIDIMIFQIKMTLIIKIIQMMKTIILLLVVICQKK